jgi:hypothetical protein
VEVCFFLFKGPDRLNAKFILMHKCFDTRLTLHLEHLSSNICTVELPDFFLKNSNIANQSSACTVQGEFRGIGAHGSNFGTGCMDKKFVSELRCKGEIIVSKK